jgi:YVTN family beta-propeller protein
VYVPNYSTANVSVFTGGTNPTTVAVGPNPRIATYDPHNGYVYVVNYGNATVSVLSGTTVLKYVGVGTHPWDAVYDPSSGDIWVTNSGSSSVTEINGTSIANTLTVGSTPYWAAYDPGTSCVAVSNDLSHNVTMVCGPLYGSWHGPRWGEVNVNVGNAPLLPAYDSSNGYLYVPNAGSSTVSVLSADTVVATITSGVGTNPQTATFDPWNGKVYVPNYGGEVTVVNGTTAVLVNTATGTPEFAAYNPGNGIVYIANTGGSTVSIINGTSILSDVQVGSHPHSVTYDQGSGDVLVPNSQSNNMSMVGTSASVAACPSATLITGATYEGYRVAWINWTDPTWSKTSLAWGTTSGFGTTYNLPVPTTIVNRSYVYSVNLNALTAQTTYQVVIFVTTSCGSGATTGSFSTPATPANQVVGWVSRLVSNSSEINQVGTPISGATIGTIWVNCVNPNGLPVKIGFSTGTSTNSSGYYSITFPLAWIFHGYTYYDLWSNASCQDKTFSGGIGYVANSHWTLNASATGYWTASEFVSTVTWADYNQFGLPPNGYSFGAAGIAYSHTVNAGCTVGITNTATQQIQNYVNILGYQKGYTSTGTISNSTTASPKYNAETTIAIEYNTTGVLNESAGNFSYGEAEATGPGFDITTDTINFNETYSSMPAVGSNSTSTTFERTVGPNSTQWVNESNGGSYTSTSGLNLQVGVSGGWGGASLGINLVSLVDLTSASSDTSHAIDCSLKDPSLTYSYQFIITLDGTQYASSQIINAHLWYKDECLPSQCS